MGISWFMIQLDLSNRYPYPEGRESVPELPKQNLRLWLSSMSGTHLHPEPVLVKQEQDLRINMNVLERYRRIWLP